MTKATERNAHPGGQIPDPYDRGLVSVIIPTYNRADMLPEAMDSVWAQTYRPIELIIVDDGSTDDTQAVVERWGTRCAGDSRFTVRYLYQENSGLPASRNAGAMVSRGEYIQFLDSDDYLHPDRFRKVTETAASMRRFDVAVTGYDFVDEDKQVLARREPIDLVAEDRVERCIRRPLWAGGPVFARGFVKKAGLFRPNLPFAEDWEYGIRVAIACRAEGCAVLKEPLVYYRLHTGPRIMTSPRTRQEIQELFSAAEEALRQNDLETKYFNMLAVGLVRWFVRRNDRAHLCQALALPCSIGLKSKILAALLLSRLFDPTPLVRLWWRLRRPAGAPQGARPLSVRALTASASARAAAR